MKSNKFKLFEKFYEENKDKLNMPSGSNYPINYKKATLWANSQCDNDSRDFAKEIVKNTRYVSFSEFMTNLKRSCLSYKKTYSKKEHKDDVFILILPPFKINKSNFWVSLLAFKFLKDIIDDIYYEVTDVYNKTMDKRSPLYKRKVRCIICDDCAYTGQQIEFITKFRNDYLQFPGKTTPPDVHEKEWLNWYDFVNIEADVFTNKISIKDFSVDLVIPYMSIIAQSRLRKIPYIKIPDDCVVFPIFSSQIVGKIPVEVLDEFKTTFQYHENISAIYFDHKIADAVSTFNKIYLLAPLFNCSVSGNNVPFIEHCDNVITKNINEYNYYIDLDPVLGKNACPPTFYKHIHFIFNNKLVDSNMYIFQYI